MIPHQSEYFRGEKESINWGWNRILIWEPGRRKFPFFSQGPPQIFWQLWELSALKVARSPGPDNKLCLWGLPRSIRGGISAYGANSAWHRCADLMTQKRRKNVLSEMCSFEGVGFCAGSFFLYRCTWAALGIDSSCCKRTGECDGDWPWGHGFNSSALIQQGWPCFLVGSSCPLTRPLGGPCLKSRRHLWNFNLHLIEQLRTKM